MKVCKFNLHVLPIKEIEQAVISLAPESYAVIVCSNYEYNFKRAECARHWLGMTFADLTDSARPDTFKPEHGMILRRFLENLPDDVTDLFICCESGESRSPAVAAALMLASGRKDKEIWQNPHYHPNQSVFQLVCRSFGVFMPSVFVWFRTRMNRTALHKEISDKRIR